MRNADVQVGQQYNCRVGTSRIRVEVVAKVKDYNNRTKFRIKNVRTGKILPKLRTGTALRELSPFLGSCGNG